MGVLPVHVIPGPETLSSLGPGSHRYYRCSSQNGLANDNMS
jgi:hypothetical protein